MHYKLEPYPPTVMCTRVGYMLRHSPYCCECLLGTDTLLMVEWADNDGEVFLYPYCPSCAHKLFGEHLRNLSDYPTEQIK